MFFIDSFFYFSFFLKLNFCFLLCLFFLCILIYYFIISNYSFQFNKQINIYLGLKYLLNYSLFLSFCIYLFIFCFYLNYLNYYYLNILVDNNILVPTYNFSCSLFFSLFNYFYFSIDLFGLLLLFLAYIVGFLSILVLDSRLYFLNI